MPYRALAFERSGSEAAFWESQGLVYFFGLHAAGDCESRVRRGVFGGFIPLISLLSAANARMSGNKHDRNLLFFVDKSNGEPSQIIAKKIKRTKPKIQDKRCVHSEGTL